jgi:alpha-tubulin suppressor-like RCC1 family protein
MARAKAKATKNGLRVTKKDKKKERIRQEYQRQRRRVLISVLAVIVIAVVGILYYLFGGASPKESTTLASGQQFSMIVQRGTLYTCGMNKSGQLGNGQTEDCYNVPVKVMDDVQKVAAGYDTAFAITKDGTLYGWGGNAYGQLADGTFENSNTPVEIMQDVTEVAAGNGHVLAITSDGSVYSWGENTYNLIGQSNAENADGVACQTEPVKIMDNGMDVSAGEQTSFVVTTDGVLYGWGLDQNGQIGIAEADSVGDDKAVYQAEPTVILENVKKVSAGRYLHTLALTNDGEVYAWGNNLNGAVGAASQESGDAVYSEPVKVLEDCVDIAAGSAHSLALKKNGDLYAWGSQRYNQIGVKVVDHQTDLEAYYYQSKPVKVCSGVSEIASNGMHSILRTRHGTLKTWGNNTLGQCGNHGFDNVTLPAEITITAS